MDGQRGDSLEAGFIGACIGFVAGPVTFSLGFLILPLSYLIGAEPADGSPGLALLALPVTLLIAVAIAAKLARRSILERAIAVGGAVAGFSGFWVLLLAL